MTAQLEDDVELVSRNPLGEVMAGRFIDAWNCDRRRVLDFVGFCDETMIQRGAFRA
jgi:hypothetical protein